MGFYDLTGNGKPQSGSIFFISDKGREDFFLLFWGHAAAVILYGYCDKFFFRDCLSPEKDFSQGAVYGLLGIAQKVKKSLAQFDRIDGKFR